MTGLMQQALGTAWQQLPPALRAHYLPGATVDFGHMDVEYPAFMQPLLVVLSCLGALVRRRGTAVQTCVAKNVVGQRQFWRRTLRYPNGETLRFDSVWELAPNGHVLEFVNPWLGLQMQPSVVDGQLHYRGVRYLVRVGRRMLPIPEWAGLGHTTIVERALGEHHFAMDFRIIHPVLGQVFRYSGTFKANVEAVACSNHMPGP